MKRHKLVNICGKWGGASFPIKQTNKIVDSNAYTVI